MANARPFYVISHRCNNENDIENSLKKGANAFECDVHYGKSADKWVVNHDGYLPLFSITLEQWIDKAYDNQNDNLCFLYLDIKSDKYLSNLIDHVHKHANEKIQKGKKPITVIYSIASLEKAEPQFMENVCKLDKWEGITVDYENDTEKVNNLFKKIQKSEKDSGRDFERFFFGNGITAAVRDPERKRKSLIEACAYRDSEYVIKKTYIWTIEKKDTAETYLEIGVDGIMTNAGGGNASRDFINNIFDAINDYNTKFPEKQVRLATTADDPFTVFKP